MTPGLAVSVTPELALVSTPHGVELHRSGRLTSSLFDYAEVADWSRRSKRTRMEKHFWWLFVQGRSRCAKCGTVHLGAMFEVCV